MLAVTRAVPPSITHCELTHLARTPIDYGRAVDEHRQYEAALAGLGCEVRRLPDAPDLPDSVFVEDTAVVLDEIAVIARPGAASRRGEVADMAEALRAHRRLAFIASPGTLDGGDVLVTRRIIFVGASGRTNADGISQLAALARPGGFEVIAIPVAGCLHLKSAVTLLDEQTLLVNPAWIDTAPFAGFDLVAVDPAEPAAANVLRIASAVICAREHVRTRERIEARGVVTVPVPAGELAKAEGGVTCCSVMVSIPGI
jgi:dimethylargininase